MRLVLDTNILVSALITEGTPPDLLYKAWRAERFVLVTSEAQITEFLRVIHYPKLKPYLAPYEARQLAEALREEALSADDLPEVDYSPDPDDNRIIATAIAGKADAIVSGDKRDMLALKKVKGIRIVTARQAVAMLKLGAS